MGSMVTLLMPSCSQDERPPLPSDITPDMESFLLLCFQKDPSKRPGARTLLNHHWVQYNRKTLRTSWSRTKGLKAKGIRTDGHIAVSAAVELMLQVGVVLILLLVFCINIGSVCSFQFVLCADKDQSSLTATHLTYQDHSSLLMLI